MNLDAFLAQRQPRWEELEAALASARGRPERLGPQGVRRLGELYRATAADLALARRRFPGDPSRARLETLVGSARQVIYQTEAQQDTLREFISRGYWRRVRERPVALVAAWALLLVPGALGWLWALSDPGAAVGLIPEQFRGAVDPSAGDGQISGSEQAAFASSIFTNNLRVSFLAFAAGILVGLGTAAVVIYNGVIIGAVGGLAAGAGRGGDFVELVAAHGVLELSCIAVTAAAGLRLGWSIVDPGPRRRASALVSEARRAVEIVLGTAPWLVLAGLIEGFVTPRGIGVAGALGVGLGVGALYWGLVLWRGGASQGSASEEPDVAEPTSLRMLRGASAPSR